MLSQYQTAQGAEHQGAKGEKQKEFGNMDQIQIQRRESPALIQIPGGFPAVREQGSNGENGGFHRAVPFGEIEKPPPFLAAVSLTVRESIT